MMTVNPSFARRWATAAPMPREAPVTRTRSPDATSPSAIVSAFARSVCPGATRCAKVDGPIFTVTAAAASGFTSISEARTADTVPRIDRTAGV